VKMGPECVKPFQWKETFVPAVMRPVREIPLSLMGVALKLQVIAVEERSSIGPSTGVVAILRLIEGASALKSGLATGR
jgi:hypothetical protein